MVRAALAEDELTWTWNQAVEAGKWDGYHGNDPHPPDVRADHPFHRVYMAEYYAGFRDRCQDLQSGEYCP